MSQPVNLNRVKKDRAKARKKTVAQENVAKFGRSKAEKSHDKIDANRRNTVLDGHFVKRHP